MKKILLFFTLGILMFLMGCSKSDSFTPTKKLLEEKGYTFEVVKLKDFEWKFLLIEELDIKIKTIYYTREGVTYFFVCEDNEQALILYNHCYAKTIASNYSTLIKDNIVYVAYPGHDILRELD